MDPVRYPNPTVFDPERFTSFPLSAAAYANSSDVDGRDHFSYGGGKRICVGLHLAERSLYNVTSRLLQAFEILPALDEKGNLVPINCDNVKSALIMAPFPFRARFKVRSEQIRKTLERQWSETVKGLGESWLDAE